MDWVFRPSKAGRALHEGGWIVEHHLGKISATPEFSFPLQFVYLNTRTEQGLFGSQWWCPQLESSLLPKDQGVFVWRMPSGGVVGFVPDKKHGSDYRSTDGVWRASITGAKQIVFNEEGWEYTYVKGRLQSVFSPTKRILEFLRSGDRLVGVQVRDTLSATKLPLIVIEYGANNRVQTLHIGGQKQTFLYLKDGLEDRLVRWQPPAGQPLLFEYDAASHTLKKSVLGDIAQPLETIDFKTQFVQPYENDAPKNDPNVRRTPANSWLVADEANKYFYGRKGKGGQEWDSAYVSFTDKGGLRRQVNFSEKRGILSQRTSNSDEKKMYYYRAPGMRYNGKLRRVEENGKVLIEYRYDKKTGCVSEVINSTGEISFYDYDPNFRPPYRQLWNPKPVRIRKGTRRQSEVVGEFAYDAYGRLVSAKNALGNTLSWQYDPSGKLQMRNNGVQNISYKYGDDGALTTLDYGNEQTIAYTRDTSGRVASISTPTTAQIFLYDKLGRTATTGYRTNEEKYTVSYAYNTQGKRTTCSIAKSIAAVPSTGARAGKAATFETVQQTDYAYDSLGRLTSISSNGYPIATYRYDARGHLIQRIYGGDSPEKCAFSSAISYDARTRLAGMDFSGSTIPSLKLAYHWDDASQLDSRTWNNQTQLYKYDPSGQLIEVRDKENDSILEAYTYDNAGNITEKIINGQKTLMTYNAANQLVTSTTDTENARSFSYDSAGRMLLSPDTQYGWLDKIIVTAQPDGNKVHFTYWPDGQIATKTITNLSNQKIGEENFFWDGLALQRRNDTIYIIEPHPSGGIPIASHPIGRPEEITWHINDLLGTTLATLTNGVLQHHPKTTFGTPLKLPQTVSTSPIQPLDQSLPNSPQTDSIQRTNNP